MKIFNDFFFLKRSYASILAVIVLTFKQLCFAPAYLHALAYLP